MSGLFFEAEFKTDIPPDLAGEVKGDTSAGWG